MQNMKDNKEADKMKQGRDVVKEISNKYLKSEKNNNIEERLRSWECIGFCGC